ncbi:Hypothetical protein NGAL_HAMBI2605_59460 [Neorhizobium galegae bv. orientalis]|nr:Hypothetical protein NGAL_HAMBI2605_59460 [Neorhizobium galegae bv. orientalis]
MERMFEDMPDRVRRLPRSDHGFPIPYFAEEVDGKRDFRVVSALKMAHAVRNSLCWVCGDRLGSHKAFVIGPMCGINRTISDPPSHRDCAVFSARNCPFLSSPLAKRRTSGLPDHAREAAGVSLKRNPGVAGVWITKSYRPFRPPAGNDGILFEMSDPTEVLWFAAGRPATRAEVEYSVDTGFPSLMLLAAQESEAAQRELLRHRDEFRLLLPAT